MKIFFNKRTHDDYISEAVKKCMKIHWNLPKGHILVFLTGEREINEMII